MANEFLIKQISVYNFGGAQNDKISGTVELMHNGTKMEMKMPMNAEDCARIFEIFADRVAVTMGIAAVAVLEDVRPVAQLTSQIDDVLKEEGDEQIPPDEIDDEIPF